MIFSRVKNNKLFLLMLLTLLFVLCVGASISHAEPVSLPSLDVPDAEGPPNQVVQIPINLTSAGDVAGMQFELTYCPDLLTLQTQPDGDGIEVGNLNGVDCFDVDIVGNGRARVVVAGNEGSIIEEGSDSVVVLNFMIAEDAQQDDQCNLGLENVIFSDLALDEITNGSITGGTFTVTIPASNMPSLDVTDAEGYAGQDVEIAVNLGSEGNVAGATFELAYDANLLTYKKEIASGNLNGVDYYDAEVIENGKIRIVTASNAGSTIAEGNDSLVKLTFTVSGDAQIGESCNLELSNSVFSDSLYSEIESGTLENGVFTVIEDTSVKTPSIQTIDATNITMNSAELNGEISSNGGAALTSYGFEWSTDQETWTQIEVGTEDTTGQYSTTLDGLDIDSQYYFKAYAVNSEGIAYGDEKSFTTQTLSTVIATWEETGQVGLHEGKVYEEYRLMAGENQVDLSQGNVEKITVTKDGQTTELTANSDSTLWFNVEKESGDYEFTVETADANYTATLQWDGLIEVGASKTGNAGEHEGNYYVEYQIGNLDLSSFSKMYQIRPDGEIAELLANNDTNLWFKTTEQVEGDHIFFIKKDGVWYKTIITYLVSPAIVVMDTSGAAGEEISVTINLVSEGNLTGLQFDLAYDSTLLSYDGFAAGNLNNIYDLDVNVIDDEEGKFLRIVAASNAGSTIEENAEEENSDRLVELHFTVAGDAQPNDSCNLVPYDAIFVGAELEEIAVGSLIEGIFTVEETTPSIDLPNVVTKDAANITKNSAVLKGEISNNGGAALTSYGFEWSTDQETWTRIEIGTDNKIGQYSHTWGGLEQGTSYYFKAYADNSEDGSRIAYGVIKSFRTESGSGGGGGGSGGGGSGSGDDDDDDDITPNCNFSDLSENHWAFNDITELCEEGIVGGYPDGTFRPENNITRAEFTKIIVGALELEEETPAEPTYEDVAPDAWFYGYIEAASKAGLVKGDDTGIFRPNANITRQEITVILVRAMDMEEEALDKAEGTTSFTDDSSIASWAKGHVITAVEEGLIKGYPSDNTFRPNNNATRAEACAMINRFLNREK